MNVDRSVPDHRDQKIQEIQDVTGAPLSPPPLTPDAVRLYRVVVAHPDHDRAEVLALLGFDQERLDAALRVLRSRRLLGPSPDGRQRWTPVAPDSAAVDMLTAEESRLRHEQASLLRLRDELLALQPAYLQALQERTPVAVLDTISGGDGDTLPRLFHRYVAPGAGGVHGMFAGSNLDGCPWLARVDLTSSDLGRDSRLLVDASLPCDPAGRCKLDAWSRTGNGVRVAPLVPLSLILFGHALAVLPNADSASGRDMIVIRHPPAVRPLWVAYDRLWEAARPFQPQAVNHDTNLRDELRMEILNLLAAGHKDELIARKVGMSVRTCRRHIAHIMEELGANSRFQAGALAERQALADRDAPTGRGPVH